MATATQSLARTTTLDPVPDTSPLSLPPDDKHVSGPLRRDRRWKTDESKRPPAETPPAIDIAPDDISWHSRLRRTRPYAFSFLTSVAVHLLLMLVAAFTVATIAKIDLPLIILEAGVIEDLVPLADVLVPIVEVSAVEPIEPQQPDSFTSVELDPGVMHGGSPEIVLDESRAGPFGGLPSDLIGLSADIGSGKASAGEGEAGGEETGEDGAEFFGVQATGKRFVFVCDCSRSMTGAKWMELNRELTRCLGALTPDKAFYVIFFDGEMHPMFEPSLREPALLDATQQNIERARFWINNVTLGRNTSPYESMKFGAKFEPDAMFLLTDGEFDDYTAPYMRGFNKDRVAKGKKKVAVHTIGFYSEKDQLVLKRIAKDSGGTYKFIKEPHIPKPKRKSWNVVAPPPGAGNFGGPAFGPALPGGAPAD